MGKQKNIKLRGTADNTIYYQWKGIDCIRTVPSRVRQTKNTKKAATLFGVAVKSAAKIRLLLTSVLPDPRNRTMMYELDGAFRKWLHTNPVESVDCADGLLPFAGFNFNKKARPGALFRAVKVSRKDNRGLLIQLPACNPAREVTAPKDTRCLGWQFTVAILPFDEHGQAHCVAASGTLPYEDRTMPSGEIVLPEITNIHSLVLVVMSIRYYKDEKAMVPVNQVRWKPIAIVGSFYN